MTPLPFTLRKPGQDHSADGITAWSTFTVHGFLHFDGVELLLEWAVTASLSEVDGLDVRSERVSLPVEALAVPLERLYEVRVRSRWWRPHLELVATDLNALFGVPGTEGGKARLYIAPADRARAAVIANAINDGIRRAQSAPRIEDGDDSLVTTPPRGV